MSINHSREVLGPYADKGFTVEEPDDDILILNHEGELVGRFIQKQLTTDKLYLECEVHLAQHQLPEKKGCR